MPAQQTELAIQVRPGSDGMRAEVWLSPGSVQVSRKSCLAALEDAEICATQEVVDALDAALARTPPAVEAGTRAPDRLLVTLTGRPPCEGEDGRLEWSPACAPRRIDSNSSEPINFYNHSRFIMLSKGQVLGCVVPPTPGEPGCDLRGQPIPPRRTRPCPIRIDAKTVDIASDGQITARSDGVLSFDGRQLSVDPVLAIRGYIDFSTGNIRFAGNVIVGKGIRDRFEVRADGDVEAGELIEAATIHAGNDLRARGGVASKEAGHLHVGRDLIARYLNVVEADVGRDALIEREAVQCRLTVGRYLDIGRGAIIGGEATIGAALHAAHVGSRGELPTMLRWAHKASVDLSVSGIIHAGTHIAAGRETFDFRKPVRGPVRIYFKAGQLIAQFAADQPPHPLTMLAGVFVRKQG